MNMMAMKGIMSLRLYGGQCRMESIDRLKKAEGKEK